MNKNLLKIGEAAVHLGVTPATLRRWEKTGELVPTRKSSGGTRYYSAALLEKLGGPVPSGEKEET